MNPYGGRPWIYFSFGKGRYLAFATRDDSDYAALYQWWVGLKTFLPWGGADCAVVLRTPTAPRSPNTVRSKLRKPAPVSLRCGPSAPPRPGARAGSASPRR
jgi:hypothetical protein